MDYRLTIRVKVKYSYTLQPIRSPFLLSQVKVDGRIVISALVKRLVGSKCYVIFALVYFAGSWFPSKFPSG